MKYIALTGRVGRDVKNFGPGQDGKPVLLFTVAVKSFGRHPKTGELVETTTWMDMKATGEVAEKVLALKVAKGDLIEIYGDPYPGKAIPPRPGETEWSSRIAVKIHQIQKWADADAKEATPPGRLARHLRWDDPIPQTDPAEGGE
jgi:hypothetical protein